VYEGIDDKLGAWLLAQPVFFVATAPAVGGHVNVSPKGLATFAVLDPRRVAYLDLTGSGVESIAHVRENGRITFMFCAFDGAPRIVRVSGTGRVIVPADPGFDAMAGRWPAQVGTRAVIDVDVDRVADSCGFGVPRMALIDHRDELVRSAERRGPDGLRDYRRAQNALSIDGLAGLSGTDEGAVD
jgi:hypothetical protein